MWKHVLMTIAIVTSAGCAVQGPPPPTYGDAFAGLYNQKSTSVPADVPVTVQQPMAIIFSDNFEKWFQFVKVANAYWTSVVPSSLMNHVAIADSDPNYLSGRVLEVLKRRFPKSEYAKDFGQAVSSGKRSAAWWTSCRKS